MTKLGMSKGKTSSTNIASHQLWLGRVDIAIERFNMALRLKPLMLTGAKMPQTGLVYVIFSPRRIPRCIRPG